MRALLIGGGKMGRKYLQKLTSMGIETSLCDIDTSKKIDGIRFFSNIDDALEETFEIAFVAIDPSMHVEVSSKLLSQGIYVLLEKPPATSLDEFLKISKHENLRISEIENFTMCASLLKEPKTSLDIYRFGKSRGYLSPLYDLAWHDLYLLQRFEDISLNALSRKGNIWRVYGFIKDVEFSLCVAWEHPSPMRVWRIDSDLTFDFSQDKVFKSGQVISEGSWDRLERMIKAFIEGKLERDSVQRALKNFQLIESLS